MPLYDHSSTYRQRKLKNIPHIIRLKQIMKLVASFKIKEPYLDVGCSNGFVTDKIVSKYSMSHAAGFDHNREHLEIASERYPNIKFNFIDLNVVNTIEKKFKLVTCFETLEHVGNLENAITNLINWTDIDGTLLISVPVETGLIGLFKFLIKTIVYSFDLKELENGKPVYFKYLCTLLYGKSISRFRSNCSGYVTHFGFDHKRIDTILNSSNITFKKFPISTSFFYLIRK